MKSRGRRRRGAEKKSSLFKSKLQGGVREEAVILRRVGKWWVKASRGRWGAQRDYQCRRSASLAYTRRPSHNETAEVFPIIALTLWCIHSIDVNNKRIRRWDEPQQRRIIFVWVKVSNCRPEQKGLFNLCSFLGSNKDLTWRSLSKSRGLSLLFKNKWSAQMSHIMKYEHLISKSALISQTLNTTGDFFRIKPGLDVCWHLKEQSKSKGSSKNIKSESYEMFHPSS